MMKSAFPTDTVWQLPLQKSTVVKPAPVASRNTTIELARVLAAYGVIAVHVPSGTSAAQWLTAVFWPLCVPFFYLTSLTFFIAGLRKATPQASLARAWSRIGVPYLTWTAIYTALLVAKSLLVHNGREFTWWRILFYGDSSIQLYFLPTLLMLQAFALAFYLLFSAPARPRTAGWLLLAGTLAYYGWGVSHRCFGLQTPGCFVGIIVYLVAAFQFAPIIHDTRRRPVFLLVGCALIALAVGCNGLGNPLFFFEYPLVMPIGGVGALLVTVGLPDARVPGWVIKLAAISFGIYLCHVLFIEAFEFLVERVYHLKIVYSLLVKVLEVTVVFLLSIVFVLVVKRIAIFRGLLLGEK